MVFLGADHRGFALKESLKKWLQQQGYPFTDIGNDHLAPSDDYVDFAHQVADRVRLDPQYRGIVLCGSGVGVDIVANKVDGIRCALVFDTQRAIQARQHEDANMIALPADTLTDLQAQDIVKAFLDTDFSADPRHVRRLEKLEQVEKNHQ